MTKPKPVSEWQREVYEARLAFWTKAYRWSFAAGLCFFIILGSLIADGYWFNLIRLTYVLVLVAACCVAAASWRYNWWASQLRKLTNVQ